MQVEREIRASEILIYGIGGVSLLVALRRVRPFARFVKPSEIPNRFVKSKVRISADVARIEPGQGGPLLMVETNPLIPLPRIFNRNKQLPIKIANVDVMANGTSWLQSVVNGHKIVFVPLSKNKDNVECRVSLIRPEEEGLEIGKELVRLGFGMVREIDPIKGSTRDKEASVYRESLIAAQKWAEKQRNGYWHFAIKPTLLWRLKNALSVKAKSVLPPFLIRQLNI